MQVRQLAVEGALEFTPDVFPDERGLFVSPFQGPAFRDAVGGDHFPVAQSNHSESRRGVVRGIHYTTTPPGMAKYVYCATGEAIDIVVDIRVGSPTFGKWDAVHMDQRHFRGMYFPVGVGHAFVALGDRTVMSYILTGSYVPAHEQALAVLDPALGLPIPEGIEPVLSERDRVAITLAEAAERGVLPDYHQCKLIEKQLMGGR
ncbi:dTDP-4-dehydrorhamnose 3,5-epimerase family protein [Saccharothrix syringae]|uniref:dTDP-4-keto-6-deoxy-D-glucose epimerase n=1 Tax=Saccharothrix syringae TaxID=103733 RepID=A0A5Q0H5C6_SACSY|nr:dTDP-4-dehydrorhamnose 3,5-epimerase family protein [Saccharothrix syringae]QFZ21438.1 dTDP-4-keto-6-deoxy-D-glucose epimerase [Saccharothrix syringae]